MVNYTTTTLNKQGTLVSGNVTYGVNVTAVNNDLTRLSCSITKATTIQQPDGDGGAIEREENKAVGNITLEHGRVVVEVIQEEDVIPHVIKFQEILNSVLGRTPTT